MSVIAFDTGFFAQIATDLRLHDWFRLTLDEKRDYAFAFSDVSEETYRGRIINQFVRRLYFANQMAYDVTYEKDEDTQFTIPLPEQWASKTPRIAAKLLKDLWSLDYNLTTNGGSRFLGSADENRLQSVIHSIEHELTSKAI